ncbi:Zinc finger protein klf1 [Cyphellophora attinorum]|uniref:Zinc finger protein klf1 n=1 Tax=Cyphellophora attinorum TaxID=1664694 RepID=A0A0N1H678_9EURO|nr:Zinc finger protein klf1 [Phialophora attinorum]KPI38137.1 Zinc finger protein klf1 [Phialophora attinorum]
MTADSQVKKHVCNWGDCGKAFSRSDHLQRHMLNHSPEGSTCERCRAHFKRPDLLERHMQRHVQKDEEAGGPGRGIVETRKRMWLDSDGQTIVSKRPVRAPPSPPKSNPEIDLDDMQMQRPHDPSHVDINQQHLFGLMPGNSMHDQSAPGQDMSDFLANSSWGMQPLQPLVTTTQQNTQLWDDAFAPDTASSFNMPYTTMNNYSWLFNANGSSSNMNSQIHQPQHDNVAPQISAQGLPAYSQSSFSTSVPAPAQKSRPQRPQPIPSLPMQSFLAQNDYQLFKSIDQMSGLPDAITIDQSPPEMQSATSGSPQAFSNSDYTAPSSRTPASQIDVLSRTNATVTEPSSASICSEGQGSRITSTSWNRNTNRSPTETGPVRSFHRGSSTGRTPTLDEATWARMIDVVQQAAAKAPDGSPLSKEHPLLSLDSLQLWFQLFWTRFNNVYPLVHQATFEPDKADMLHLLAMLLLGATYSDKNAHRLAVCIHDIMRPQIFLNVEFTASPPLWMLQTILLVECFGKSRAGQKQHDMSHLFHGLLINLIRRSDCQSVSEPDFTHSTDDLTTQWRLAMEIESRKRLAFLCFMWDTQHAVLFSQSLCMSSFELRAALPCSPSIWEAESEQEWQQHYQRESAPRLFLPILKAYMSPTGSVQVPYNLNALSRLLILHGLMSVSWDMKRRDDTSLGCGNLTGTDNWRERLGASYDLWRADFDAYCLNVSSSLSKSNWSENANIRSEFQHFTTSTLAIYHAAHIVLNVEVLDLQIYAGARHIIGRQVSTGDFDRSRRKVREWSTPEGRPGGGSESCTAAVWHAAHLLRDGIMNLDNFINTTFHYSWCLYLATLVLWSFHNSSRPDRPISQAVSSTDAARRRSDSVTDDDGASMGMSYSREDAKAEMNALVSGMTSGVPGGLWRTAGRYSTRGLVTIMSQDLSNIRWAVVHEGVKVLKGLTARQDQYDAF